MNSLVISINVFKIDIGKYQGFKYLHNLLDSYFFKLAVYDAIKPYMRVKGVCKMLNK